MLLNDVFERFVQDSPVSVMVRGLLENTLSPRFLDELFANAAELQYTRTLLFSSVVDLLGLVVNRIQPTVNSAYHARAKTIGVSLKSVYNKLDNLETGISAAMVGTTAERLETVVTTMGGALPPLLPGYRIKILDGNHLAATEHRIKELRTIRAGAMPGQALVVLDPSLMLVTDVVLCEDGHAQERSLLGQILEIVRAKDVWIDDRNFCTTGFLFGIARREAFFVVRQHAATLHWEFTGKKRACGRIETGKVFEQTVRLTNPDTGEVLFARRITVVLDSVPMTSGPCHCSSASSSGCSCGASSANISPGTTHVPNSRPLPLCSYSSPISSCAPAGLWRRRVGGPLPPRPPRPSRAGSQPIARRPPRSLSRPHVRGGRTHLDHGRRPPGHPGVRHQSR